jgi:glycosyltransferase involved in cell wall biosynthesis
MYKGNRITVVIPCLNEEHGIKRLLQSVPTFVDEVIVVDNNSSDRSAHIASSMGATVVPEFVRGYGRAYKTGFSRATGDIIATLDADCSYPIGALSYLLDSFLQSGVGFISASRFPMRDYTSMKITGRIGNLSLSALMSVLFLRRICDSQSGMWVFSRDALKKMKLRSNGMAFSEEIKIEALRNASIGFQEIPVNYFSRVGQRKLEPWKDGLRNLTFLFRKRFAP